MLQTMGLTAEIDVDALPRDRRDVLIRQRLAQTRPGDAVRLTSAADLHPVWRRQHACNHNSHIWVYEECGPVRWRVRVTRRSLDDY